MKVVRDTSGLFSMIIYPSEQNRDVLEHIIRHNKMVIFDYVADELLSKIAIKRPGSIPLVREFISSTKVVPTIELNLKESGIKMRDAKDQPILDASLAIGADVLLSGDKDFTSLKLIQPRILTLRGFVDEFLV